MNTKQLGSALALSLLLAACGETQNNGSENRPTPEAGSGAPQSGETYSATGKVTAIAGDQVTISHGPVEGLGWPAMTMTFRAGPPGTVEGVSVGDRISFAFRADEEGYVLTSLSKSG